METFEREGIRGRLHHPEGQARAAMGITHGAGSDCDAPLIKSAAEAFAADGYLVLRYDLPFRQLRPKGSPVGSAQKEKDQEGIRAVARELCALAPGVPLVMAGHSYGGRMTSMAAARDPQLCDRLLLLSYPLHPPGKPEKARTEHFPALRISATFVHGTKDDFGTPEEMEAALTLIPAPHALHLVRGAGHGLAPGKAAELVALLS